MILVMSGEVMTGVMMIQNKVTKETTRHKTVVVEEIKLGHQVDDQQADRKEDEIRELNVNDVMKKRYLKTMVVMVIRADDQGSLHKQQNSGGRRFA